MNIPSSDTEGTITDLTPLTNYNCSVHAVTKFGGPKSNFVTVRTDEGGTGVCRFSLHIRMHVYT